MPSPTGGSPRPAGLPAQKGPLTAMQIRLTVLAPGRACDVRAGRDGSDGCDLYVTAPAGTALAAVASGLATAVLGADAPASPVFYAGRARLDAQRALLGVPPLVDGAVLSLGAPGEDEAPVQEAAAQLRVVGGPDAGGVHLLHGGRVVIGRSAEADVPLDDPDVSRLHCAVTVAPGGTVTVADLGSTNGTSLDGAAVGPAQVPMAWGAWLRLGESTLTLAPGTREPAVATAPDGEGHLRLVTGGAADRGGTGAGSAPGAAPGGAATGPAGAAVHGTGPYVPGPYVPGPAQPSVPRARQGGSTGSPAGAGTPAGAPAGAGAPQVP
ncbi:FHA domain-containing protein, partial [Streptomyces tremellae]|uniref:FHA domain-containing protein n=1 Tax=Streptomyces tremellae TaxID=1124239 RepID=UPI003CD07940